MSKTMTHVARPRPRGPKRFWIAFRRIWRKKHETTIGQIVTVALVLAASGWGILAAIERVSDAQNAANERENAEEVYEAALLDWRHDRDVFDACLQQVVDSAATRDDLRSLFVAYADISDIAPDSERAQLYTETRVELVDALFPPIDIPAVQAERCVDPGPSPINPSGG